MLKQCLLSLGIVAFVISVYYPTRHARRYEYIETEKIFESLQYENQFFFDSNLKRCNYQNIILKNEDVEIKSISSHRNFSTPFAGGEYIPKSCFPLIKTAIIVPYRRRSEQRDIFLKYMHPFLQNQFLHYRIFFVEQNDTLPFNRAKMLNYGAKMAIEHNFGCLILHDVDLIPINTGNIYACSKMPRHMSSSLDTFRYNLPYLTLFGGAVAILSKQFKEINGMSNVYYGWGGEDDDFYRRVTNANLNPCRFSPEISKYTMLIHTKEQPSQDRYQKLEETKDSKDNDGLSTLSNKYTVVLEKLYTLILAS